MSRGSLGVVCQRLTDEILNFKSYKSGEILNSI